MIGKIIKGNGFTGTLAYLFHGNKERPKDSDDVKLIGGNMVGRNARELAFEFNYSTRLRPDIKRHVVHIPLSLSIEEHLNDAEWRDVAERHLNNLGYNDNQWVMVRHSDTDHEHVHIVACSIRWDGSRVNDSMDYKRCARSRQAIERDFDLLPSAKTPKEARARIVKHKTLYAESEVPALEYKDKKDRLKRLIKEAGADRPSMTVFINRLNSTGVLVGGNISSTTRRITGILFTYEDVLFKGSKLGKNYA